MALLCGLTMAVVTFVKLLALDQVGAAVALAVSLALVCTVVVAKLVGCLCPMLAKKLGFDPAIMASPIITTLVDIVSLLVYFLAANALLV